MNGHYVNINDNIVKNCKSEKQRIRIFTKEDGKLWFDMDESFKFKEREHPHPETNKTDSELVSKHIDDWRNNNPPISSEIWAITSNNALQLNKTIETIGMLTNNINSYGEHIKSHTGAIIKLDKGINRLFKFIEKNMSRKNIKSRINKKQTKLGDFL